MTVLGYNERSWAIDVITEINRHLHNKATPISRAGGESTLSKQGKTSLYPDVLLYGDDYNVRVRHGWELKFPNTPLDDKELIANAIEKANRLKVNSFVLWNVDSAALYLRSTPESPFSIEKSWGPLGIAHRGDVQAARGKWLPVLVDIIDTLNGYFADGRLKSASVQDVLSDASFYGLVEELSGAAAGSIESACNASGALEAQVNAWWIENAVEHGKKANSPCDMHILARVVVTSWLNRFLFCHYLKRFQGKAKEVENIQSGTTLEGATKIFEGITAQCDFLQVFKPALAADKVGAETWDALCQLNAFLTELDMKEVPHAALQEILEGVLASSRRKIAGQFPTPFPLAQLLVTLAMEDRNGHVLDPCCGTGTIPKAAYALKRHKKISEAAAFSTVWASDKFQFPLQLTTLTLADPTAMGEVIQVFNKDVFTLSPEENLTFTDPSTGNEVVRTLPLMSTIVSNLPFVRFEDIAKANPIAKKVLETLQEGEQLSGKSDLYAYVSLHLKNMLADSGRLGLIISNSWLNTEWGKDFREVLQNYFHIQYVVTSGNGRWFGNADVVTNLLVLQKKKSDEAQQDTKFLTTKLAMENWNLATLAKLHALAQTTTKHSTDPIVDIHVYSAVAIREFEGLFAGWTGLFADMDWMHDLLPHMVKASSQYDIARGERRGWNDMFYPSVGHGIEAAYIKPVLLTSKDIEGYVATTASEAFCCSESIESLKAQGHTGALAWIERFAKLTNTAGKSLPQALAWPRHYWYEMTAETQADLVMGMNPEDRLFVARMNKKGFVDQRLIRFTSKANTNVDLTHALLNSTLGMLMIELSGFGRGLGALDLQPTKLKSHMMMLSPEALSEESRAKILTSFEPVKNRKVLPLKEELQQVNRQVLDEAILSAYGVRHLKDKIQASLEKLYDIRKSVK